MGRFIYNIWLLTLLCVLLLFSITVLTAQQEEKDKEKEEQKEQEKTKLNLPDVIIYGQEKIIREAGTKLNADEEKPNLLNLDLDYQFSILKAMPGEDKLLMMHGSPELGSATSVTAQFGNFNTPLLHLIHAQEFNKIDYNITALYHQSDGQFRNSQFSIANGRAHLGWNIRENLNILMNATYFYKTYGLHGSFINDLSRQAKYANGEIASHWNVSENSTADIHLHLANFELTQENDNNLLNLSESSVKIMAGYNQTIRKMQLTLGTKFWHDQSTNFSRDFDYFFFESMLTYPFMQYLSLNPALAIERVSDYESRVSPGLEIVFTPSPIIGVSAKANRYLEPYRTFNYWQQNPYLHTSEKHPVSDVALNLELNMEYQIIPNVSFRAGVSHKLISDYSYWQRDNITSLFKLEQFNDVALSKFIIGFDYNIADVAFLNAQLTYYDGSIDDNINTSIQKEIPYLAKYQVPVKIQFNLNSTATLSLQSLWSGARRFSVYTDRKLDSFMLVSAKIEKTMFTHYEFYIGSDNLLDDEFLMWENYPHIGLQFYLGIKAKW